MKKITLKLFVFLFLTSLSFFGQTNTMQGTAGAKPYIPQRGYEVSIEVRYKLRVVSDEIELYTYFEARPAGGVRYYHYKGKKIDLNKLHIYPDFSKIKLVNAVLRVDLELAGRSKNIKVNSIERDYSGSGIHLRSSFGLNREEFKKYQNQFVHIQVNLESVEVSTIDYEIERKIDQWLQKNGGSNGNGGVPSNGGVPNNGGGPVNGSIPSNDIVNKPDPINKNEFGKRRPMDEIPDDKYNPPMDGKGRELKPETFNNSKKPTGNSPQPINTGEDWGVKAPVTKIVFTKTEKEPSETALKIQKQKEQGLKYQQEQQQNFQANQQQKIDQKKEQDKQRQLEFERQKNEDARKLREQNQKIENLLAENQRNSQALNNASEQTANNWASGNYIEGSQPLMNEFAKQGNTAGVATTAILGTGLQIFSSINKAKEEQRIADEKAAYIKRLEDEKQTRLTNIKDNLINNYKSNKDDFFKRAASEILVDKEKYYLDMANYYQCKIDKVESRFTINNTDWVDSDCDKVKEFNSSSNENPSDKELYEASLRKFKNSNAYYQMASKDFVEMAIKKNPKKADYFFHRAKFEELGSKSHINFLIRTLELNKSYPDAKKLLSESLAEKKRIDETTFFDSNWKVTNRKSAVYYRPFVEMVDGLYHVKDYYASNNQLQMEGYANEMINENIKFEGKVVYYYETGKVDNEAYYDKGILKQLIDNDKNGYTRVVFYKGEKESVFDTKNYGKVIEIKYSENGFIEYLKWDYTRPDKKKYYEFHSFTFDQDGNLLFRDIYNDNGVLKDKIVEDNIEAMHRATLSYIDDGQSNEAIKFLENGIVLYPNDAFMYYYLAIAKSKKENIFTTVNKGVVKNLNMSLTNKISKNDEEAIKYFNKAIELSKENPDLLVKIYEELAEVYFKLNLFNEAVEVYENALKFKPKDASLLNSYSRTLATSVQKLDKAEQMIKLCNEITTNNYNYLDTYSWVLYKQGRFKEADTLNDKALKFGGEGQAIIWEHKGDIWYKLGEKGNALIHWEKAKSLNKVNGSEVSAYLNQKIKKKMLLE